MPIRTYLKNAFYCAWLRKTVLSSSAFGGSVFKQALRNLLLLVLVPDLAVARLSIVTTTTDLRSICEEVAGEGATVEGIAKGTQDPHYIEAKPSFMVKANRADLVVSVGMELEAGWLPNIIQGARNPKINPGKPGFLEVGPMVKPLEVPSGKMTRAEGDIHPFGNPHVTLDPIRAGEIAIHIAKRLSELDPDQATGFQRNAKSFQIRLEQKTQEWKKRVAQSNVKSVITYHKTLSYFLDRFGIQNPAILEPKPGIPPTSGHILSVIQLIKGQHIPVILVENFFDPSVTNKIKQEVPGVRAETVAVAVEGAPGINKLDDLIESLVKSLAGK